MTTSFFDTSALAKLFLAEVGSQQVASGVITRHPLRSLDAVQLGSALSVREKLEPHEDLLFVAVDERLLKAASAEGLTIWNPELDPRPDFVL